MNAWRPSGAMHSYFSVIPNLIWNPLCRRGRSSVLVRICLNIDYCFIEYFVSYSYLTAPHPLLTTYLFSLYNELTIIDLNKIQ